MLAGKTSYLDHTLPEGIFLPTEGNPDPLDRAGRRAFLRAPEMVVDDNDDRYLTDVITDEAIAYIRDNAARQFYVHVSYTAPHVPVQTTVAYWDRFPQIGDPYLRARTAMIAALDDGIGRLLAELDALGLTERTAVIFTSDNGCAPESEACPCTSQRGLKGSYYDGGISVPFLLRLPSGEGAGTVYTEPLSLLDVFPTALALAQVAPPPGVPLDGVNLAPHLLGADPTSPHPTLIWRATPRVAVRSGDAKFLWLTPRGEPEGYDLASDPLETVDRIPGPHLPATPEALYDRWERQMRPPDWEGEVYRGEQCGEPLTVGM